MNFRLVIFDWDGTLMDSVAKIVNCVRLSAKNAGVPVPEDDQSIKNIIGLSLDAAIQQLFPLHAAAHPALVEGYKTAYRLWDKTPTPLFYEVETTLQELKARGHTLAVATGKGREGLDRLLAETGLGPYFCHTRTACEAKSKPHPDMLHQLLKATEIPVHEAVMIGDTHTDMKMAQAAGMAAVGVTFGVHDEGVLKAHNPIATVDRFADLLSLL